MILDKAHIVCVKSKEFRNEGTEIWYKVDCGL
jgi:hypothetical protein